MARNSLFQSAALAVLAAVGVFIVPAQAHPEDQEPDRQEARAELQESRQTHAERQVEAPQQAPRQEEARAAQETAPHERQSGAPRQYPISEDDWRSQRASDGQRDGRNRENDGEVSRPTPDYRGEVAQMHDLRGAGDLPSRHHEATSGELATQRNRTYSDPHRSGTYGGDHDHDPDHSAESRLHQHSDRNGTYTYGNSGSGYRNRNYDDLSYGYQNGYGYGSRDYGRWDHNDWRRDTRYNWSGYRNQHRDLYRAGRYYSPYNNFRYSRLSIGFFLNSGFYGQNYWINDPWQYRLPQMYGSYRWVRYYDDVVLVNIYSGEVVDVVHDFFW